MHQTVSASFITIDVVIYYALTVIIFYGIDAYAARRMGGKRTPGYLVLRVPKQISLLIASGLSCVIVLLCWFADLTISTKAESYLGIPYLIIWFYYMMTALRRIKAETSGQNKSKRKGKK